MTQTICPFCLVESTFDELSICPNCKLEVPQEYIAQGDKYPVIWLVTLGFSQHGKTCYLSALSLLLDNLYRVWPNAAPLFLGENSIRSLKEAREQKEMGVLPLPSGMWRNQDDKDKKIPHPMLIRVDNVPVFGTNYFVLTDTAGEYFGTLENFKDEGYLKLLKATKTIWFLISITDLQDPKSSDYRRMDDLISIYLQGMRRLHWDTKNTNLIVTYTKADRFIDDFPASVQKYYFSDPLKNLTKTTLSDQERKEIRDLSKKEFPISDYLRDMNKISDALRKYTLDNIDGGKPFITLAEEAGMNIYFTLNSSLGIEPERGRRTTDKARIRIIDPLLWALKLHYKGDNIQGTALIIDPSYSGTQVLNQASTETIARELQEKLGKLNIYLLGTLRSKPVSGFQTLISSYRYKQPRLIGPILQNIDPETRVLVITSGLIKDLDDFYGSSWEKNLFVVTTTDELKYDWPNLWVASSQDQINRIVKEFHLFCKESRNK